MNALLRALLLRNRYCAPAGSDGELPGGAAGDDEGDVALEDVGGDDSGEGGAADGEGEEDGDLIVSLGGEDEPADEDDDADEEAIAGSLDADAPNGAAFARIRAAKSDLKRQLKDVQRREQEQARRTRELEEQLQALRPAEPTIDVGAEPDLDNYTDEYDTLTPEAKAKFKADHAAWAQRKLDADAQKAQREQHQQQQHQQWQKRLVDVEEATGKLGVKDQKEAVQSFDSTFSIVQRGIVMGALDEPQTSALMRYALGRNTSVARKLAAINDPVKFAVAIGELKATMKVTKGKKIAPAPDKRVKSGASGVAAVGNTLDRLEAEAAKTGDRTKVARYHRELAKKAA